MKFMRYVAWGIAIPMAFRFLKTCRNEANNHTFTFFF